MARKTMVIRIFEGWVDLRFTLLTATLLIISLVSSSDTVTFSVFCNQPLCLLNSPFEALSVPLRACLSISSDTPIASSIVDSSRRDVHGAERDMVILLSSNDTEVH